MTWKSHSGFEINTAAAIRAETDGALATCTAEEPSLCFWTKVKLNINMLYGE